MEILSPQRRTGVTLRVSTSGLQSQRCINGSLSLLLYFFNVRDAITGKWRKTRYRLTDETARAVYGEGNYERLDWTREVRTGDAGGQSTAHLLGRAPNSDIEP